MAQTILVVDGEEVVRDIVTSMLRSGGYESREAQNGLAALTLLESGDTVDLILSELMMLELDGIGLLERVKEKYPSVPFAIMTAVHDESVAEAAISRGACDYLLKPFEREQLMAVVRRALATRAPTVVDRDQLMARIRQEIEEARKEAKTRQPQPPLKCPRLLRFRKTIRRPMTSSKTATGSTRDLSAELMTLSGVSTDLR